MAFIFRLMVASCRGESTCPHIDIFHSDETVVVWLVRCFGRKPPSLTPSYLACLSQLTTRPRGLFYIVRFMLTIAMRQTI